MSNRGWGPLTIAGALIFALLLFGTGFYMGSGANASGLPGSLSAGPSDADVSFAPFWKAWQILDSKFVSASSTATVTDEDKLWGAIEGLAASYGDPYTVFMPPREAKVFAGNIAGSFGGVGMEVGMRDNVITVIAPLEGTPAAKAGILPEDKIIAINGKSTQDMTIDEAVEMIRGPVGTVVKLTVLRGNDADTIDVSITRGTVEIPTIDSTLHDDGVFVIALYSFSENSPELFKEAITKFANSGSNDLVLDLRGNPGGYLGAAVDIASYFLPQGSVVVMEDQGQGEKIIHRSLGYDLLADQLDKLHMTILVNGGSASAAEILAGALKEHEVAELVGTQTFGKGSVQELVPITSDTSLKVTVARWLTPDGVSISGGGLTPTVVVPITAGDISAGRDPQMTKAVQIVKE
jgi:carboxyl-terminal processing protease